MGTQGTARISTLRACSKAENLDRVDEADNVDGQHDAQRNFGGTAKSRLAPTPSFCADPLCLLR